MRVPPGREAADRVLITPRSVTARGLEQVPELEPLRALGYRLVGTPPGRTPTREDLISALPGCVGWIAGVERIDQDILAAADGLRVISRNGAGVDAIDLAEAARAGICVERANGANAQGVAELTLALALSALRYIALGSRALRNGVWSRQLGRELGDLTVGVVGLGAIGRRVASMFTALGSDVVGCDPFLEASPGVKMLPLEELLAVSDLVSLHVPGQQGGGPLITADRLRLAPAGVILINTARASLVDDEAVLESLETGTVSAYAVDAFETEPPAPSPLLQHERVIATPHLGAYTDASIRRALEMAVTNLIRVLEDS